MAQSFNEYADVIYMNPSMPDRYFRGSYEKKYILLPMRRFKVLVPYPKDNALNLFQETILKLLQSGAKDIVWLADVMALDVSLVEVIIDELISRKYITKKRSLTEAGRLALENESFLYEMKTGYIFYNYLTNTYMDAFVADNQMNIAGIRNRILNENKIQFYLDDSVENSRYENAVVVRVDKPDAEIKPTAYDVMDVCKKQRNRARMIFAGDYKEASKNMDLLPRNIEKVKLLDDNADVYVATFLAIPTNDLVNRSNIQICYPFGEGFAVSMMANVLKASKTVDNEPLAMVIDELKNSQTQLSAGEKAVANRVSSETVLRVQSTLSDNIVNHPYVYEMALEVEDRRGRVIQLLNANKGSNWEAINADINKYIISNYGLLAAILIDCSNIDRGYSLANFTRYLGHNAECLSGIAIQCGFTDENDVFSRFFRVFKKHVEEAREKEELNALIALNLLEADQNTTHPFYRLGVASPDFITKAYDLKGLRSEGMHGNDLEYNFKQVEQLSRYNFEIASVLLNDLSFNENGLDLPEQPEVDEFQIKIRKDAENQVEKLFTENVYKYSGLTNLLTLLLEEEIREGNSYPSRAAAVLEYILKELCKYRLNPSAAGTLQEFTPAYKQQLIKDMRSYGFQFTRIPFYNSRGISKSFSNYRMGTLGTNFYVWYLSETTQVDCVLHEVGKKCPAFVRLVDETASTREHKGKMVYSDNRLSFLKDNLKESINSIIDLMVYRGFY